jgi:hypothetical protein
MSTTPVPALLRQQVDRWAETWLTAKFSRLLELRAQDPGPSPDTIRAKEGSLRADEHGKILQGGRIVRA